MSASQTAGSYYENVPDDVVDMDDSAESTGGCSSLLSGPRPRTMKPEIVKIDTDQDDEDCITDTESLFHLQHKLQQDSVLQRNSMNLATSAAGYGYPTMVSDGSPLRCRPECSSYDIHPQAHFGTPVTPSTPPSMRLWGSNSDHGGMQQTTATSIQHYHSAMPEKPKRPLSAYNFFFQLERERIIEGKNDNSGDTGDGETGSKQDNDKYTVDDVARIALLQQKKARENKPKEKRSHRKTHGKISFGDLARTIANKWKKLDESSKAIFEGSAAIEKERYKRELLDWNKRHKKWKEAATKLSIGSGNSDVDPVGGGGANTQAHYMASAIMHPTPPTMDHSYRIVTPPSTAKKTISPAAESIATGMVSALQRQQQLQQQRQQQFMQQQHRKLSLDAAAATAGGRSNPGAPASRFWGTAAQQRMMMMMPGDGCVVGDNSFAPRRFSVPASFDNSMAAAESSYGPITTNDFDMYEPSNADVWGNSIGGNPNVDGLPNDPSFEPFDDMADDGYQIAAMTLPPLTYRQQQQRLALQRQHMRMMMVMQHRQRQMMGLRQQQHEHQRLMAMRQAAAAAGGFDDYGDLASTFDAGGNSSSSGHRNNHNHQHTGTENVFNDMGGCGGSGGRGRFDTVGGASRGDVIATEMMPRQQLRDADGFPLTLNSDEGGAIAGAMHEDGDMFANHLALI